MESKKIKIGDKEYEVYEIKAYDYDKAVDSDLSSDRTMNIILGSSNISEDEYKNLILSERETLLKSINQVNGWGKSRETKNSDLPKEDKD